jgi:hypothetical protein
MINMTGSKLSIFSYPGKITGYWITTRSFPYWGPYCPGQYGHDFVSGQYGFLFSRCRKYVINSLIHGHFHIGLVIIPRPILGLLIITRPIWKSVYIQPLFLRFWYCADSVVFFVFHFILSIVLWYFRYSLTTYGLFSVFVSLVSYIAITFCLVGWIFCSQDWRFRIYILFCHLLRSVDHRRIFWALTH